MAKTIRFNYEGTDYILEFTRKSIEKMENDGFVVSDIRTKPMSTLPELFKGAFLAHHRYVKQDTLDKIFASIVNKDEFLGKLAEMYNEPLEALIAEPDTESEGNVMWEASW